MADESAGTPGAPVQQGMPPPPSSSGGARGGARAGFWMRLLAAIIDGIVLSVVGLVIGKALGQDVFTAKNGTVSYRLTGGPFLLTDVVNALYFIVLEGSAAGQTLGKKVMGIRVVGIDDARPIGYGRAFVRWIGRLVSALPCFLGFFWMLWDGEKQTWHDKFSSAVVVPESAYPKS